MKAVQASSRFQRENKNQCSLIFVNGVLSKEQSRYESLPKDIMISGLESHCGSYPELVKSFTDKPMDFVCYIPRNFSLKNEIHLLFTNTEPTQLNCLIYLEEGAELNLFQEYLGEASQFSTQIHLGRNAKLNYYKLQACSASAAYRAQVEVSQKRDSHFNSTVLSLGAKTSRDDLNIKLEEANASCTLKAFTHACLKQALEHHTLVEHVSGHCQSEQVYKAIAQDQAKAVFKGRVKVHEQAQKTNAAQSSQNLLLSSGAEIDAKPELEIYADDVKCSHGSTVGQLDPDALFYLRSRGLDVELARHLLTCAFAMSVLEEGPHENIRQYLKQSAIESLTNEECCGGCQNE